jgi:hypothetical protein
MNRRPTDLKAMRRALRALPRGNLLIIAERATELLPKGKLKALLADAAGLGGEYYEEFDVHSKNVSEKSKGTDAFIAEFDRLTRQCIRAAKTAPQLAVREAIELLLDLLRQIDKGNDEIIFFADDGGSWDIGVDWGTVFPAYFRCLAETASAEVFAQVVDQVIMDFADYQRPQHWRTAHRVADVAQKAALRAVTVVRGDRV